MEEGGKGRKREEGEKRSAVTLSRYMTVQVPVSTCHSNSRLMKSPRSISETYSPVSTYLLNFTSFSMSSICKDTVTKGNG